MKTSAALQSNGLMVFPLLPPSSRCMCVNVCASTYVWVCAREKGEGSARTHDRLTFFGHITNLFIYFAIPLRWAPVFPEECAHSKAISIRLTPSHPRLRLFPAYFLILFFCLKEQSWLILRVRLSNDTGFNNMRIKDRRREDGLAAWLLKCESPSLLLACLCLHRARKHLLPYLSEHRLLSGIIVKTRANSLCTPAHMRDVCLGMCTEWSPLHPPSSVGSVWAEPCSPS